MRRKSSSVLPRARCVHHGVIPTRPRHAAVNPLPRSARPRARELNPKPDVYKLRTTAVRGSRDTETCTVHHDGTVSNPTRSPSACCRERAFCALHAPPPVSLGETDDQPLGKALGGPVGFPAHRRLRTGLRPHPSPECVCAYTRDVKKKYLPPC